MLRRYHRAMLNDVDKEFPELAPTDTVRVYRNYAETSRRRAVERGRLAPRLERRRELDRRVQPSTLCMSARRPLGSVCPLNARQGRHATKVRARPAHAHLLATAEISTNASLGNRATCTVARAGGLSLK
jgi:hypothetical protein